MTSTVSKKNEKINKCRQCIFTSIVIFPAYYAGYGAKRYNWRGPKNSGCYTVSTKRVERMIAYFYAADFNLKFMSPRFIRICFVIRALDKTISNLEMELASAKASQEESELNGAPLSESTGKRRYFMVIGINTAFSSRKRRDSLRATWMPQGCTFFCMENFFSHSKTCYLILFLCLRQVKKEGSLRKKRELSSDSSLVIG